MSILHRVSGALLFLVGIPFLLWLVQRSLRLARGLGGHARARCRTPLAKLVLLVLAWAYLHHLLAGIRYLLLDLHVGIDLEPARQSAAPSCSVARPRADLAVAVRLW